MTACGFIILFQVMFAMKEILFKAQNFDVDGFMKNVQLAKGIFYVSTYIVLIFLSIKMSIMSFSYIDILD